MMAMISINFFQKRNVYQYWQQILKPIMVSISFRILSLQFNVYIFGILHTSPSDIGTSTLRFRNAEEMSNLRGHNLFSSVVASSSCVHTIIETYIDDEVFNAIDMMNAVRAERKHLLLIISTFKETMFKNIIINFAVTIQHSGEGDVNITTD